MPSQPSTPVSSVTDPTQSLSASSAARSGSAKLSAHGLHELAVQAFRIGNRGRLSLCEALRALEESRLFLDLGFPSIAAYADSFFQLRRSEAYEYVPGGAGPRRVDGTA